MSGFQIDKLNNTVCSLCVEMCLFAVNAIYVLAASVKTELNLNSSVGVSTREHDHMYHESPFQ